MLNSDDWWATNVILNFYKSIPVKKHTHLHRGWPLGECISVFG